MHQNINSKYMWISERKDFVFMLFRSYQFYEQQILIFMTIKNHLIKQWLLDPISSCKEAKVGRQTVVAGAGGHCCLDSLTCSSLHVHTGDSLGPLIIYVYNKWYTFLLFGPDHDTMSWFFS